MAKDCIGIVFGRFNPPHKGHKAAWEMMASECTYWFVGTNKSTLDIRNPLPYEVKKAAMKAILPEVRSHIVPEKTWLTMAANMYKKYGDLPLYCYTDENWVVTLLQKYNNVKDKEGNYYNFSVIEKKPTPRISSASSLRQAVEEDDRNTFFEEAGVSEDFTIINPEDNKSYNYFDLVKKYLTLQEVYMPKKYRAGLSKSTAGKRKKFWIKLGKYPYTKAEYSKAEKVPGDAKSETRPSQYNDKYQQMFGESRSIKALQKKAKATGIPYGILKQVYNRGMAAWVTGHRPGATQSAWAFARVNSFVTKGKTWRTADADLAKKARKYLKEDNGKFVYVKSGYITPSPWIVQLNESNNMTIKQLLTEDQYSIDRLKKYVNDPTYIFSSDTLNRLIDDFPFDGGVVYRGMNFLDQKSYENFVKDIQDGKLKTATLTSWTRDRDTAHQFAITRPTYHFNNILAAAEKVRIDIGDYMIGYRGLILKTRVQPNIALDVNKSGVAAEDEVILPPGTYTVEIESEEIPYKYKFADNQKINNQILSFDKNNFSESQKNLLLFVLKNKSPEDLSAKTKKHIFNLLYESNRNSKLAYDISKKSSFSAIDHRNTVRISMGFNPILLHYINIFDQIDRNKLIKDCDTVLKNIITLLNSKMQEDQIDISVDRVELSPLMSVIIDHASPGMAQKYVNYIKKLVSAKYNELNSSVAQLNKITDRNRKQEEISNFMKKIQNVMNFAKSIIPSTAKVEAFNKVIGDKESLKESNDSSKFSIKPEDLKDALMVLKDWSYEYNVRWNDSIDKIWNNLVKDGYIDSLNVSELNELNEVFADYLEYDMWGWVTPTGKVILPTKADADSEYEVTHFNILKKYFSRVDAYEKYDAAYESGWIRFLIEDRILYFNCILSDNLPEILTKAKNTIEEYAKNPKKFYYFIGPDAKKATRSFKKDGIGMLSIDSYDLDLKLDRWNEISTKKFNEFKTLYNLNKSSTSFANLITRLNNALSHPEAKKFMFNEKIKEDVTMDHMDYEIEMASSQLKKIADLASNILNYIQNKSELDAWVQDKISVSAHNMEAIYDNYFYNEDKLEENIVNKDKKYYLISKKTGKNLGGPYSSKKKAQERERQVQYFKNK